MFQQLPGPAPVSRFYSTGSLSVGERTPGVGIVGRCEPAAVKLWGWVEVGGGGGWDCGKTARDDKILHFYVR